jgi:hypothetical protein
MFKSKVIPKDKKVASPLLHDQHASFLPPPPNLQQLKGKQSANEKNKAGGRTDMAVSSANSSRHQLCNYAVGSGKEEVAFIWDNMKDDMG